jgi:Domain of unknown function (DUF1707)/Cell wall-active antibiotics response 4TMS YvqF
MVSMTDARHERSLSPVSQPTAARGRAAAVDLRASDADRDRTAAVLSSALATGRLTRTEYAERLDAAYGATTLGDLEPLTRDLPADETGGVSVRTADRAAVAARFSKVIRSGRWVAGRHTQLTARFGALIVNLAEAVLPGREITLNIDAFFGKIIIIVPVDAQVIDEGGALFAKRAVYSRQGQTSADGPVIRLVGDARFSKVSVHRGHFDPSAPWQHWTQYAQDLAKARTQAD